MKPAPFDYVVPGSVEEAVGFLADEDIESHVLAGGQSLIPAMNMRMARPELLVDIGRIEALNFVREDGDTLVLGTMTTKREVEFSDLIQTSQPVLHAGTMLVAHPQIRNRSTVGGSIAHADSAAEYPALALLLEMDMVAVGTGGERTIPASDFFHGYFTTALEEGELLKEIRVPKLPRGRGWGFREVARRHGDFAMAGVGVTLDLDSAGHCTNTRIVAFALGDTPVRATKVEDAINGEKPSDALFASAAKEIADGVETPMSDVHASVEYRRELASVLAERCLAEAVERAQDAVTG